MRKKKNLSQSDFINMYMDYVLENGSEPESVFKFAKAYNFEEQVFYKYFTSFEGIRSEIFTSFLEQTLTLLNNSEDYEQFDVRNKLLSFYFTFFEIMTANRSYVVYALKPQSRGMASLKMLKGLRRDFLLYIDTLDIEKIDFKEKRIEKFQDNSIKEASWTQLLLTIKFWLEDSSASFEKTDVFIEKSVNAGFDIMNVAPIKSVLDLGKFLFKEKFVSS
ncbi:MAG: heat-shock protein [Bacteroidetes bacterium MedPE-SWsnd-G2]|nr:MAG: heat-shock protein [Bacteroidetes bacterium MedPE-SWsnd-G2]